MKIQNSPAWSPLQRPTQKLEATADGKVRLDSIRWGLNEQGQRADWTGEFGEAVLDPAQVKNVYLGVKPFSPRALAAHSTLIFEMAEPIQGPDGRSDSGLVLSMEARLRAGEQYKLLKTLNGKYEVVYQLGTLTDLMQKSTRKEANQQYRYLLDLEPSQKQELLKRALEAAVAERGEERYNLFTNSCHSVAIDLVNSVVPEDQQMKRWLLPGVYNPLAAFPPYADILFARQDLLADSDPVVVNPDPRIHPEAPQQPTRSAQILREVTGNPAFKPLMGVAGGAVGGALGYAIQSLPAALTVPLGALGGAYLAWEAAETVERRSHTVHESASKYVS